MRRLGIDLRPAPALRKLDVARPARHLGERIGSSLDGDLLDVSIGHREHQPPRLPEAVRDVNGGEVRLRGGSIARDDLRLLDVGEDSLHRGQHRELGSVVRVLAREPRLFLDHGEALRGQRGEREVERVEPGHGDLGRKESSTATKSSKSST